VLLRSGYIAKGVDTEIDGLWFRLVAWRKIGNDLTLTFEDREVNVLRTYPKMDKQHGFKVWPAAKYSRVQVARQLVQEPKEYRPPIPFISPALKTATPATSKNDLNDETSRDHARDFGFAPGNDVTVKGHPASKEQLDNIDAVLQTGVSLGARRKVLVTAVMVITQESVAKTSATNGDHVGLFQQSAKAGWPATRDPVADSTAFFEAAMSDDAKNPSIDYAALAEDVQASGQGALYAHWRTEAEHTVASWGLEGGDTATNTSAVKLVSTDKAFQYVRGTKIQRPDGSYAYTFESNWDALQRLAQEVQ
jgi:hypothetical protein